MDLEGKGVLPKEEAYVHMCPYDWRTKKPDLFRPTEQWFTSVQGFSECGLLVIKAGESLMMVETIAHIARMVGNHSSDELWAGVLQKVPNLKYPVKMNLEVSDQHTRCFRRSLLASVGADIGMSLCSNVLTHCFLLDESSNKISKGTGNTMDA
eukprot:evm.model.scf_1258.3 EVM.evm.TU.scf_1258.3   scf_1258:17899-18587(+)